ncbi:uncharacterized protein N0V89_007258 [Didymosphaeria variabile]|uniref:Uncharacterized protein n=1 Tax=Didymosphaeria variabile TaxID=1932322 RepID=A0A9W8XJ35_9PLEO|nr:uncharacterized protein N0V89_007258 [Didymosphaeria variabile]KAJ4351914.1 hypothetical protein N0V89_007258 [Didymosphaeria variabile]
MRSYVLASLATATAATQIPFFVPGMGSGDAGPGIAPVASIVKADASTTVMALACPTGTEDTECGWGSNDLTITVIAKTVYALSVPAAQVSFDCTSKKDMTCTAAIAAEFTDAGMDMFTAGNDGTATGTTVYPSSEVVFQTASVTAGEEKLSGGAAAASTTAAAKETGASASSTLKTTGSVASTGASPSATGANVTGTTATPAQSTGAASKFGAAFLAVAGAAAVYVL